MHSDIKIITGDFKNEVTCYFKNGKYDVYVKGACLKLNASLQWCMALKVLIENDL